MPRDSHDAARPGHAAAGPSASGLPFDPTDNGRHRGGRPATGALWGASTLAAKVLGALIAFALLLGFAYGWQKYHALNSNLTVLPIAKPTAPSHHDIDGTDQNILIVGNDDRSDMTNAEVNELKTGRDGGSLATDTMILVHVPANGDKATLISLPRDSYVSIPGYGMNKLNSAYASAYNNTSGTLNQKRGAGASLLEQVITNLTGLTIDSYVQVDLLGFYRISNAIKGVTVNLCRAVDDSYSGLKLSAGVHSLQGVTALEFVRQRHGLPNGDIDRVARQRYFLTAAFRKIASAGTLLNPGRLSSLISAVDSSLYVGPGFNVLKFAGQISGLNADNIAGQTIPFVRFETVDVGSVEIVDPSQVQQFVRNLLGTGQEILGNVAAAAPSTVTVRVVNGGAANGAAAANAARLDAYGFHTTTDSQATPAAATTIEFASGMEAAAKALAATLPKNVVLQKSTVSTLTLVLGADGLSVAAHPTSPPPASKTTTAATTPPKPLDAGCIN